MSEPRFRVGRRPRLGVLLYLLALAAAVGVILIPPLRAAGARRVETAFDAREAGWILRVEEGEALLASGDFEAAAAHLEDLDRRFPARGNVHALDKERERVLVGLGRANEGLGRKGRALAAYRQTVLFDPLNVENHYALAAAALRLDEGAEAERHLALILETYPAHELAARDRIAIASEAGDFRAVRETFEAYAGAFRVREVTVSAGEFSTLVSVPEDGEPHTLRITLPRTVAAGTVTIRSEVESVAVSEVHWVGRAFAGRDGRDEGAARALGDREFELPQPPPARLRITARAPIPISAETWRLVETAYRNLLATEAFDSITPRLMVREVTP